MTDYTGTGRKEEIKDDPTLTNLRCWNCQISLSPTKFEYEKDDYRCPNCLKIQINKQRDNSSKNPLHNTIWPKPIPINSINPENNLVNHPKHYTSHPSGIECIQVARHMNFNLGNCIKYIWRAGEKGKENLIQDLEKAAWYLNDEINRLKNP